MTPWRRSATSAILGDVVSLLVSSSHGSSFDLVISLLLENHVGFQHYLELGGGQFSPMLRLERISQMQLFHLGMGSREGLVTPLLQTNLE
jgi:hypothetical protein